MITEYLNATLLDARGMRTGSLFTGGERIVHIGHAGDMQSELQVDLAGLVLMPALIDMHCHLRDPGYPEKETMETGMRAALKGGFARLCAMANTKPVCATPALVSANHEKARTLGLCYLMQAAAAGVDLKDEQPTDYEALSRVTGMLSNDGNTIFSDAFMRNLLLASTQYGFLISTHCQPERAIIARDIALLSEVGGNLHVGHISHAQSVAMIREAKAAGLTLSCEATPHHLFGFDDPYKVNPPLRARTDVDALIEGIRDGTVDCLSTDHAPHTPADKAAGMAGISNFEYALQVFLYVFHENDIPLTRLAEMTSFAPAKRLGICAGLLESDYPADLVAFDPDCEATIDASSMISRSHNTPFDGRAVRGSVHMTIVGGKVLYNR